MKAIIPKKHVEVTPEDAGNLLRAMTAIDEAIEVLEEIKDTDLIEATELKPLAYIFGGMAKCFIVEAAAILEVLPDSLIDNDEEPTKKYCFDDFVGDGDPELVRESMCANDAEIWVVYGICNGDDVGCYFKFYPDCMLSDEEEDLEVEHYPYDAKHVLEIAAI